MYDPKSLKDTEYEYLLNKEEFRKQRIKMELKKYKLGDIADIIGGVAYSPADVCASGIRVLRGGNVQSQTIELRSSDVFLPISYKNSLNQVHIGDTVVVASTGSVEVLGKAATCFEEISDTQIGAFLRIVRPKHPKYAMLISIALNSRYFSDYIKSQAKGTSINNINIGHLCNFEIYIAANNDIEQVSHFYLAIQKKIAINRQINDNLEMPGRSSAREEARLAA